ncbi:MAG: CBS domain-containing protein [Planctomycetaceae bacterium]|nr:CBS domain-containing protein [Planctomycetaceae bacterium]
MDFQLNLDSETVEQVSSSTPPCVDVGDSVGDVLNVMKEKQRASVLVCREGALAGIFTERDALKLMLPGADLDAAIETVMTASPETLSNSDAVGAAISKMSRGGYRRLPIVDTDGHPQGFVKVRTILHYLVGHFPSIVYNLPPAPHHTTETREGA